MSAKDEKKEPVDDGGPAFPANLEGVTDYDLDNSGRVRRGTQRITSVHGMSLRDWFAGQALVGISALTVEAGTLRTGSRVAAHMATTAYLIADAMLKARARRG